MLSYFLFAIGLAGVMLGAHILVLGASRLAAAVGISPLIIGLTVVGFGTSAPEMVVSAVASFQGNPETALGNVTGSNVANIGLILGTAALIMPLRPDRSVVRRDGPLMLVITIAVVALAFTGEFTRVIGIGLLLGLAAYLVVNYFFSRREPSAIVAEVAEFEETVGLLNGGGKWKQVAYVVGGLALLLVGGQTMVTGAVDIAEGLGISEFVIASTIVAIGTSTPELATSVVAAFKREADIAVGNVVGSNVFNLLGVLGIGAVIAGIPVNDTIRDIDMPLVLGFTVAMLVFAATGRGIGRVQGVVLLVAYVVYMVYLLAR